MVSLYFEASSIQSTNNHLRLQIKLDPHHQSSALLLSILINGAPQ